jgi:ADP-ribose pyrophosphatase YjhB (NUDIX family)
MENVTQEGRMITFYRGDDTAFNFRTVAVMIHEGHVLIHRSATEEHWTLPGGRVELLEPSPESLRREMLEEIGVEVEVGRMLWVVESFIDFMGKHWHEIAFNFLTTLPPDCPYLSLEPFKGVEDFYMGQQGLELIYEWHPVDRLQDLEYPLYPEFLCTELQSLPEHPVYVLRREN